MIPFYFSSLRNARRHWQGEEKLCFKLFIALITRHRQLNSAPYRANCPIDDPVMAPGALIDVAKYVGSLTFHVWEKMHTIVKYSKYSHTRSC